MMRGRLRSRCKNQSDAERDEEKMRAEVVDVKKLAKRK